MRIRMTAILAISLLALSAFGVCAAPAAAQSRIDLSGQWKFSVDPSDAGLRKGWHTPGYDSSKWNVLQAPGKWENQGITLFNLQRKEPQQEPYDGYAWYRRSVVIPGAWKSKKIYLNAGYIDDSDWTYVNGAMVGNTGSADEIAPQVFRAYEIPAEAVRFDKPNTIAIRAFDKHGDGGIMRGPISLTLSAPEAEGEETAAGSAGTRPGDKVNSGGNMVIKEGETVSDAVNTWGDLHISGHVLGDAVAIGGDVILKRTGRVDGDVISLGGTVTRASGSQIGGDVVNVDLGGLNRVFAYRRHSDLPSLLWGLPAFVMSLLYLIITVVIAALIPNRIDMIATVAFERPGRSALFGVIAGFMILPIGLALLLTIIGIPLLPLWGIVLLAAGGVGRTAMTVALARKLAESVGRPLTSIVLAALVGGLVWAIVQLVPFAGVVLLSILGVIGFGATWMTMFGSHPDWFANRGRRSNGAGAIAPPQIVEDTAAGENG